MSLKSISSSTSLLFVTVKIPVVPKPFLSATVVIQCSIYPKDDGIGLEMDKDVIEYENIFYLNHKIEPEQIENVRNSLKQMDYELDELLELYAYDKLEGVSPEEMIALHFQHFGIIGAFMLQKK